ncbi:MAG: hypothetical protein H8E30_03885 [Alphaproteobacteria bacterium]|nr:hypothetical protein [Alphaproteobacteria bacterium]
MRLGFIDDMGESNLIDGRVSGTTGGRIQVSPPTGDFDLPVGHVSDGKVSIVLRPEHLVPQKFGCQTDEGYPLFADQDVFVVLGR